MNEVEVRIIQLEPLRVASALGFGQEPEHQAWQKLLAFAKEKDLMNHKPRFFGFNNPSPSAGSPNYGYEQWVTVGPEVAAKDEITVKTFPGGLYAVLRCPGIPDPDIWRKLVVWREHSAYKPANHQWLEELLSPPEAPEEQMVFDLYLPIAS